MPIFVLLHFLLALGCLLLTQILFVVVNHGLFSIPDALSWCKIFLGNLHFGISATAYFLSPFLILFSLPLRFRGGSNYLKVGRIIFVVLTGIMIAMNLFDVPYFQWTLRRSTAEIFSYAGQNFSGGWGQLIVRFLRDFWYYFVLFFVLEFLLWQCSKRIILKETKDRWWLRQPIMMVLVLGFTVIGMRGGIVTQHKPLSAIDATRYADAGNSALVINTPFSIVRSLGHESGLPDFNYYEDNKQLEEIFTPVFRSLDDCGDYRLAEVQNVVLVILESFSEEYIGALNGTGKGWTPFLDSLVNNSLVFEGLANGKRSIESLPALFSGIPSLMEEAYITSPYSQNKNLSLPELLRSHGFATAFFHGAYNGSMNFDSYCHLVGVDDYYGMDQYQNDRGDDCHYATYPGFDGTWGIYDEPFLQYTANKLNSYNQPFFATIYSISSHHPFAIPEPHKNRFPKGELPILETVGYADYALSRFFRTAAKMPWYRHTLFIVTADHAAMPMAERYSAGIGRYRVPMLFFWPAAEGKEPFVGRVGKTLQHSDLYPTLVDLLGLDDTVTAFGKSAFSKDLGFHISYGDSGYQLLRDGRVTLLKVADSKHPKEVIVNRFRQSEDPLLKNPLPEDTLFSKDLLFFKALLQQYSTKLKGNSLR